MILSVTILFCLSSAVGAQTSGADLLKEVEKIRKSLDAFDKMVAAEKLAKIEVIKEVLEKEWMKTIVRTKGKKWFIEAVWRLRASDGATEHRRWLEYKGVPKDRVWNVLKLWNKKLETTGYNRFHDEFYRLSREIHRGK